MLQGAGGRSVRRGSARRSVVLDSRQDARAAAISTPPGCLPDPQRGAAAGTAPGGRRPAVTSALPADDVTDGFAPGLRALPGDASIDASTARMLACQLVPLASPQPLWRRRTAPS